MKLKNLTIYFVLFALMFSAGTLFSQDGRVGLTKTNISYDVLAACVGAGSIIHDDGNFENGYGWNQAVTDSGEHVDKFTPSSYPYTIDEVCLAWIRTAAGSSSLNYFIVVYDDDGPGGAPGTRLAKIPASVTGIGIYGGPAPGSFTDYTVTGQVPPVTSGSVYVGVFWPNTTLSNAIFLCADQTPPPNAGEGYSRSDANAFAPIVTGFPDYHSMLIRVLGSSGPPPPSGSLCFSRSGLNKSIPDNNLGTGVYDTIHVTSNAGTIDDITAVIDNIQHTWVGDLVVDLIHGGQTDTLLSRIGTGAVGNETNNLMGLRFTDSATVPIASFLVNTTPIPPGNYLPGGRTGVDSLRKHFKNQNLSGDWILRVRDGAAQDQGTLEAWSLCFYSDDITQIISSNSQTPDRYSLAQNYPNPFNPTTKIKFALPKAGLVSLKVYDMLGKEVQTLVNQQLNAGEFIADFDGANLSSGTYFYRLQVGDFVEIKKMVLLK